MIKNMKRESKERDEILASHGKDLISRIYIIPITQQKDKQLYFKNGQRA